MGGVYQGLGGAKLPHEPTFFRKTTYTLKRKVELAPPRRIQIVKIFF